MMGIRQLELPQETTAIVEERPSFRFSRNQSIALVFGCTILGAAAQILMKTGTASVEGSGLLGFLTAIVSNMPLLAGYSLYGLSTVLLVLALRDGELSLLYPVISLTFVWVTILSAFVFQEAITVTKVLGISIIVAGVGVLGRANKK